MLGLKTETTLIKTYLAIVLLELGDHHRIQMSIMIVNRNDFGLIWKYKF